jgi:hypothetical protein
MTALGDFSSGDVLTAADLNAIGTWTAFTPSWTNLTVGNGTQTFYYCQINDVLMIEGRLNWGSTTAITSNYIRFAAPVGTMSTDFIGQTWLRDDGVSSYQGIVSTSGNNVIIQYYQVSGSKIIIGNVRSDLPFTWTTGDYFYLSMQTRLT